MLPVPGDKPVRTPARTPKVIGTGTLENNRWFDVYRANTLIGTTNLEVIVELISTWTAAIHIVHIACRDPRMWD